MGYNVTYEMIGPAEAIAALRATCDEASNAFDEYGTAEEPSSQWRHEYLDLAKVSKLFPDALLVLDCAGETDGLDSGRWRFRAKGGKVERIEAALVWPDMTTFDDCPDKDGGWIE